MLATQNMGQTLLGTVNSTKGKKVEPTIHHAKQPQLLVRVSMIESLNEEIEIKLSSLSICCSSFQSLATENGKDEQPRDVCALGTLNRMCVVGVVCGVAYIRSATRGRLVEAW